MDQKRRSKSARFRRQHARRRRNNEQNYRSDSSQDFSQERGAQRFRNDRRRGPYSHPNAPSCSAAHSAQSSSSSTSNSGGQEECDIPGYYYDKEKKTYFKILPNNMSSVSSFVTMESIKKRDTEKQRLSDIRGLSADTFSSKDKRLVSLRKFSKQNSQKNLIYSLSQVQCGQFTCENFRTHMIRHSCSTLQPDNECVSRWPLDNNMKIEDIQKLMVNSKRDQLVCVWSLKSSIAQCLQLMSVDEETDHREERRKCCKTNLTIRDIVTIGPIFKKVTTLCWAPVTSLPNKNTILYTTTCPIGYSPSIAYLNDLDASTPEARNVFELNLGKKMVWSSAWQSERSYFSVGSERMCHLVDVATRRMWSYNVRNSDPLAQIFSHSHPNIMYNGTRAGIILKHDTRSRGSGPPCVELKQRLAIACLRLLRDENYIMASDFTGTICLWDQRIKKTVCSLTGLVNSHYQLPFNVDETETVVCGVGSDSYTRLWDKRSGDLLRKIPAPYPASLDTFPNAHFSSGWLDGRSGPALVIAMKDKFKIYR